MANAPYFLHERYGALAAIGSTLPHLGLLTLGAVLQTSGHRVRILDASAQGIDYNQTLDEILKFKPDVVGFTAVTSSILKTVKMAAMVKARFPSMPVIIGGPHATAIPEKTLLDHSVFDYAVIGEGEITIIELVDALMAGRTSPNVPGTAFVEDGLVRINSPRSPISDLDTLPFPSWGLLDRFPALYRPALFKYQRLPSTHIVSSRGCPHKCIFCDTSVFSRQVRFHSSEYVLGMIDFLVKQFGIKEIIFEDDQFLVKKGRVRQLCEGVLKAKLNIAWSCSARVTSVNDLGLLRLMKRSGCWQINYGIESGNQHILDFAQKGITLNQVETAVRLTREAGILSKGYFILGLPLETEETMENTIRFAKNIPLADISAFMLTPFPGSRIYEIAAQYGTIANDFEIMNVLDVAFVPKGLSKERLRYYQRRFMKEFYLRPRIIGNYFKRFLSNPLNFVAMFKALCGFLRAIFGKSASLK